MAGKSPEECGRMNAAIEPAENGFIVRVGSESHGKEPGYKSATYVAPSHGTAVRIASSHFHSASMKAKGKGKGKRGGKKRAAAKA